MSFKNGLLVFAWTFILGMTVLDVLFAYLHRDTIREWEINTIALWAMLNLGLGGIIAYKAAAFAALLVALRRAKRAVGWATGSLVLVHLFLLTLYLL